MKYYSTRNKYEYFYFKDALISGLAKDGGLFVPESLPSLRIDSNLSFSEIAFLTAKYFIDKDISDSELSNFIDKIFFFTPVLKKLDSVINVYELFHGPTLAFKDFGARFMAEFMSYYASREDMKLTILVATSGDTGSAVAHAFYKKQNIDVFILYPSNMVSNIQEKQLTTFDSNIKALEIKGTFDDCQRLVKSMFMDDEVKAKINLTSANSINIARLLPQTFYYIFAMTFYHEVETLFVVPSGNLGNLTAGLYANKIMNSHFTFLSALNSNNVFEEYIRTGKLIEKKTICTISNAMDVCNPSNLERINHLFSNNLKLINREIKAFSVNEKHTESAITDCFKNYNYILDPHSAVGYAAITQQNLSEHYKSIILLETAHPAKFIDVVERNITAKVDIPSRLKENLSKQKKSILLSNNSSDLKEFLLSSH